MTGFTRSGLVLALLVAALVLVLSGYQMGLFERPAQSPTAANPPDLSNHPIYRGYQFGQQDNVIDLGTQPLFLPGVISEVMRRDSILRSALAARGMEIRFHAFLKGADVNFFLARGELEAGIGGDMPTLLACANSNVLVTSLIDQHFAAMVARRPMMIPELKGKRIAYAYGSQAHYMLLETLAAEGLGPDEVRMIAMDVTSMADALQRGTIDVFTAWEPTPTIARSRYPGFVTLNRGLGTGYLYFSRLFAEREPELVKYIVAAQLRAMAWIKASPDNLIMTSHWALDAGKSIGGDTDAINAKQFASIINASLLGISSSALLYAKDLAVNGKLYREFHFLQELTEISASTHWEDVTTCFNRRLVPDIISQSKRYQLRVHDFITGHPRSG